MITRAVCDGAALRIARYASRSRRRARFRWTAPRTCRLTAKPARRGSSVARHSTIMDGRSIRLPRWKSAWKSALLVNRSRRGNRPFRRSAVSAPSRADASKLSGRLWSSSAPGSRESSSVVARLVETSASLSVFPLRSSNRPSVDTAHKRVNSLATREGPCDAIHAHATFRHPSCDGSARAVLSRCARLAAQYPGRTRCPELSTPVDSSVCK